MLAVLVQRGMALEYGEGGYDDEGSLPDTPDGGSRQIWPMTGTGLDEAMTDVFEWLGFTDDEEYLTALEQEEAFIFRRATY